VFDDEGGLNNAIEELQIVGFDRSDIAVLPPWKTVQKAIGREVETVDELVDSRSAPRMAPVDSASLGLAQGVLIAGPLYLASCGAMLVFSAAGAAFRTITIAGIAAGAMGGMLGILPMMCVRWWHQRYIDDMLDHGGLILWVCALDECHEERARTVLARHFAREVRICYRNNL